MDKRNVEDIYPLSPMQQGMLFHSLYAPESSVYFTQMSGTLHGERHAGLFRSALQRAVDRHPILRTSFLWDSLEEPLQVVRRSAELPVEQLDWRDVPAAEQASRFEALLASDRARGFDLSIAPLMRLTLVQSGSDEFQFVWSHHHILLDGWSFSVLLQEVWRDCEATLQGVHTRFAPAPPYREFIAWMDSQDRSASESFWRNTLSGFMEPSRIASAKPVDPNAREHGLCEVRLSEEISGRLSEVARQNQLTLNTLVQAAWALVLSRNSGRQDVVFGSVVSGRPASLPGVERMVGLFINALPVREEIDDRAVALDWLQGVQARVMSSRAHEHTPMMDIQAWSELARGTPLFDSIVVFENYPSFAPAASGRSEVSNLRYFEKANYPVTVIARSADRMSISLNYDPRFVPDAAAHRLAEQAAFVLEQLAENPRRRLGEIGLVHPTQAIEMLRDWNRTATSYPARKTVHDLFEMQAELTPSNLAVRYGAVELTYEELNRRANRLARFLLETAGGGHKLIALLLNRSPEFVVAALAVLKCGHGYVPLDPDYPRERLEWMLADTQAPALITCSDLTDGIPEFPGAVICLDRDAVAIERLPGENLGIAADPQDLVYAMYTSGSTGLPKAIGIPHQGIVRLVKETDYVQIGADDRIAQASSVSFDAATFEIWGALLNGACVVGVPKEVALSAADLRRHVADHGITTMFLTTALFNRLSSEDAGVFSMLRYVLFGGERADAGSVRRVVEGGRPAHLLHVYGPTESTTFATWQEVSSVPPHLENVPIGRPIANTTAYVLDADMAPVAISVSGELYLGGDGLARGYVDRPELTATSFVPDPFSGNAGARLYRTGDIVRYTEDGAVEFVGRRDGQVKIRGFRIEPGEVESVLRACAEVRECAVMVREDIPGQKALVAYAACDGGVGVGDLRGFLRERLPEYMMPSAFVLLTSLPLNANGKVDRRALPAPDHSLSLAEGEYVAPETAVEEVVTAICGEVLGTERVGTANSFFELGGNSLSATQFISRLREVLQAEIPLRTIFERPELGSFCELLLSDPEMREHIEAMAEVLLSIEEIGDVEAAELSRQAAAA